MKRCKVKETHRNITLCFWPMKYQCVPVFALNDCRTAREKAECRRTGPSKLTLQNHPTVRKVERCAKMQRREEI